MDRLAAQIGAAQSLLPTYGKALYDAHPYIEVDALAYHYVVKERGEEIHRFTTPQLDELLYTIFADVTFTLAGAYETAHRVPQQDPRRLLFRRQEELLARLSPHWSERETNCHQQILRDHPYDDAVLTRSHLMTTYREQGYAPDLAWQRACQQYPLPI